VKAHVDLSIVGLVHASMLVQVCLAILCRGSIDWQLTYVKQIHVRVQ